MTREPGNCGTALVTGANRGLGLEYCRQLVANGWRVLAATRHPEAATGLQSLAKANAGQLRILKLDVVNEDEVQRLGSELRDQPLDLLINNAGTFGPEGSPGGMRYQSLDCMDYGIWRHILEVNLLAPFRLTVTLAPSLRLAPRPVVIMVSSDLGSIGNNRMGQSHAYRTSKAGLNMLVRSIANEWRDLIIVAMAPGWCKTELGGQEAPIEPEDSVRAQLETFIRLSASDSGRFLDRFGAEVAW